MNRSIKVERLYSLGDYKNIKFTDEMLDIPADVALNPDAMANLRMLLMVGVELSFERYMELKKILDKEADKPAKLEEMRVSLINELKTILNGHLKSEN